MIIESAKRTQDEEGHRWGASMAKKKTEKEQKKTNTLSKYEEDTEKILKNKQKIKKLFFKFIFSFHHSSKFYFNPAIIF